jgi:hypothetical protein
MDEHLFDIPEEDKVSGQKLLDSHRYWSKKRILFNIIVGSAGIISVLLVLGTGLAIFDLFGIVTWGVVANAMFSIGYIFESYIISKSKGQRDLQGNRDILFWIGTIAYVIVGFIFLLIYSFPIPD